MQEIVFRQDPGLRAETFILKDDRLIIVEKGMGLSNEKVIRLSNICPDYELRSRRFSRLYLVPSLLSGIMLWATWKLFVQQSQDAILQIVAAFPAAALLAFLWHSVKGFAPIESCRFRNKNGGILFEIYRPRKAVAASAAYDDFIATLTKAIKKP